MVSVGVGKKPVSGRQGCRAGDVLVCLRCRGFFGAPQTRKQYHEVVGFDKQNLVLIVRITRPNIQDFPRFRILLSGFHIKKKNIFSNVENRLIVKIHH